jgi:SAM-dependent methyltransferase
MTHASYYHRQKAHFESIHNAYASHYYDGTAMAYREEFIFSPMLDGLDLNYKSVAELAAGSGHNSVYFKEKFPHIKLVGFDISAAACADYERFVGAPCYAVDLMKPAEAEFTETFDAVFVIGGLHHCVSNIDMTLTNVANMLKPGGFFLMAEPNSLHLMECVRKLWYRLDPMFDHQNEHALDHNALLARTGSKFEFDCVKYFGGPAYFAIFSSMIMRIPLSAKPWIAPLVTSPERLWNRLPGPRWHSAFVARWRRRF